MNDRDSPFLPGDNNWHRIGVILVAPLLFLCNLTVLAASNGEEPLEVLIYDRPPFYIVTTDPPSGLLVEPTRQVFETAGIPFSWNISSPQGSLIEVERNTKPICATGWFRNKQRERFARYTEPFFQDATRVVVFRLDDPAVLRYNSFRELFEDKLLRVGLKEGYSYGKYIDRLLKMNQPQNLRSGESASAMLGMLLNRQFDYFLLNEDEIAHLLEQDSHLAKSVSTRRMGDSTPGSMRHILCSMKTDEKLIEQLDASIQELGLPLPR